MFENANLPDADSGCKFMRLFGFSRLCISYMKNQYIYAFFIQICLKINIFLSKYQRISVQKMIMLDLSDENSHRSERVGSDSRDRRIRAERIRNFATSAKRWVSIRAISKRPRMSGALRKAINSSTAKKNVCSAAVGKLSKNAPLH